MDERTSDTAPSRFRTHRERPYLGEVARKHGQRAAPEEAGGVLCDQKVAQMLEQEVARALEHAVLGRVPVDHFLHICDVLDPRRPDGDAQRRTAPLASASASRTPPGARPPRE